MQYATAKAGIVLVNLNPAYRTSELEYALRQSGCRALIAAPSFKTSDYAAMIESVRGDLPQLEQVVLFDSPEWEALARRHDAERRAAGRASSTTPINIQYTSGTTGFPKGATLSHSQHPQQRLLRRPRAAATPRQDRVCIPVPFYHCFGMVMGNLGCTTHGSCMVIPEAAFEPGRDAARPCRRSAARRSSACRRCSSPSSSTRTSPRSTSSRLRTGIMAGSPCPIETMRRVVAEMHMEEVTICYGMTETSPVSTQTGADDPLDKRVGTVGRVHPHVEIKVVDPETGHVVGREASPASCAPAATP